MGRRKNMKIAVAPPNEDDEEKKERNNADIEANGEDDGDDERGVSSKKRRGDDDEDDDEEADEDDDMSASELDVDSDDEPDSFGDDSDEDGGYDTDESEMFKRPEGLDDILAEEDDAGAHNVDAIHDRIQNASQQRVGEIIQKKIEAGNTSSHKLIEEKKDLATITESVMGKADIDEHLGEDFLVTQWVPPKIQKAADFKGEQIYLGSQMKRSKVKLVKETHLGIGMGLFFHFEKSMAILLGCMALLSLPALICSVYGNGISIEERDTLGLYQMTLGNLGYNKNSDDYATASNCTATAPSILAPEGSTSCFTVFDFKISTRVATNIFLVMELLQTALYFIVVWHLSKALKRFKKRKGGKGNMIISDYTVQVTNLPHDITKEEIIEHFSSLYQLKEVDHMKRPPVDKAEVVTNVENTLDPSYLNSWVVGVYIHKQIGPFMHAYREKLKLYDKMYKARAIMKMYAPNTQHFSGPNPKKVTRAEKVVIRTAKQLDRISRHLKWETSHFFRFGNKKNEEEEEEEEESEEEKKKKKDADRLDELEEILANAAEGETLSWAEQKELDDLRAAKLAAETAAAEEEARRAAAPVEEPPPPDPLEVTAKAHDEMSPVSAYVTFNYSESMARCVEDYQWYQSFPWKYFACEPRRMHLKGKRIKVEQAQEPEDIIWENLELPMIKVITSQIKSNFWSILLLIIGFAIVLQAGISQAEFTTNAPDLSLCNKEIPALYKGQYMNDYSTMSFEKPDEGWGPSKNANCEHAVSSSFYSIYVENGDTSIPSVLYHHDVCNGTHVNETKSGLCPQRNQTIFCPCVSLESEALCTSLDQSLTFPANSIAYCSCLDHLQTLLVGDFSTILENVQSVDITDPCYKFILEYAATLSITYAAIFTTVVINKLIKWQIKKSGESVVFFSINAQQKSLLFSLFLFSYVNLVIAVLIAFTQVNNDTTIKLYGNPDEGDASGLSVSYESVPFKSIFESVGLFQGTSSFTDFTRGWYAKVGPFLILVLILEGFSPLLPNLYRYYIINPWLRCCNYVRIQDRKSHLAAYQADVNHMEVGPVFDPIGNAAHLLLVLFFVMTFAPGIPILVYIGFFIFVLYAWADKLLLLRYFRRPPKVEEGVGEVIMRCLPWAAIIRLGVACWMFSNQDIFPPGFVDVAVAGQSSDSYTEGLGFYQNTTSSGGAIGTTSTYIETFIPWATRVLKQDNTFVLFVVIVIILLVKIIRKIWFLLPFYWVFNLYRVFKKMCCGQKKLSTNENGFIKPFDIFMLKHPLRRETAPFTGGYYKFIRLTDDIPGCWEANCKRQVPDLTEQEEKDGWQVTIMDDLYDVKAKVFGATVMIDGYMRNRGTYRYTYEVMGEDPEKSLSYDLKFLPLHKMKIRGLGDDKMFALMWHAERNKLKPTAYDVISSGAIGKSIFKDYMEEKKKAEAHHTVVVKKEKPENLWKREVNTNEAMDKYMFQDDDDDDEEEEDEEDDYDKFTDYSDD